MTIDNLMSGTGPSLYYSTDFRNVLEDAMNSLRADLGTFAAAVEPYKAIVFSGDLFGLLSAMSVPAEYHFVIMRMNGFNSPTDIDRTLTNLIMPDNKVIERLASQFRTERKIKY